MKSGRRADAAARARSAGAQEASVPRPPPVRHSRQAGRSDPAAPQRVPRPSPARRIAREIATVGSRQVKAYLSAAN
jgi:hypothetical protein